MWLITLLAVLILFFSFLSGMREGAAKSFFSGLALVISLPITSAVYHILAALLSFLPGQDWENFLGFFITLAIVTAILHLIFFLPRRIISKIWEGGCLSSLLGGAINLLNTAIGLTVLALILVAFPIWGWLAEAVQNSSVIYWLLTHLVFLRNLLPAIVPHLPVSGIFI